MQSRQSTFQGRWFEPKEASPSSITPSCWAPPVIAESSMPDGYESRRLSKGA